jgi:hypothetical protein
MLNEYTDESTSTKTDLARVRRKAKKKWLRVARSRRPRGLENFGGLMVVDMARNAVLNGVCYDLTLKEAENFVDQYVV